MAGGLRTSANGGAGGLGDGVCMRRCGRVRLDARGGAKGGMRGRTASRRARGAGASAIARPRAASLNMLVVDTNTVIAVVTALLGVGGGIGLVAWTENQGLRTEQRVNDQPCFDCKGSKQVTCGICKGNGLDPVFKSQEEPCSFCEGKGAVECDNCNGTGIQPRFLDRLSPDDFMD
ncbi:Protein SPA, chloroplastic [Porphyridium purpureum]|uniref:Protein SPA, chloroplastic n=1 Tax=Porphyridium purpureum TaxID=35688 RepID=A0A5J4YNM6_PORPP|nr:Protein SPA, chloroplastic [Porphyridium purpureum]|eukprot:POR0426..scf222_8